MDIRKTLTLIGVILEAIGSSKIPEDARQWIFNNPEEVAKAFIEAVLQRYKEYRRKI